MNKDELILQLKNLPLAAPMSVVDKWLERLLRVTKQSVNTVLKSYEIGPDGARVSSIIMLSEGYISELKLSGTPCFDVAPMMNTMRFAVEQTVVANPAGGPNESLRGAKIHIIHDFLPLSSALTYIGEDGLDEWIDEVWRAFPISNPKD